MCTTPPPRVRALVSLKGRTHRYLSVGWLCYLGTLVPVLGLVQVGEQARADRYTCIPSIGVLLMVVWGLWDMRLARTGLRRLAAIVAVVVLAGLPH